MDCSYAVGRYVFEAVIIGDVVSDTGISKVIIAMDGSALVRIAKQHAVDLNIAVVRA